MNRPAYILQQAAGLFQSAQDVVAALSKHEIPHLIAGNLAVLEYGSPRVATDLLEVVVPDVLEAVEFLTASLTGPFYRIHGIEDRVEDHRNGVKIDLLPAGKILKHGCKIPFPEPAKVAEQLQFISLEELISLKLDSWSNSPNRRIKDKADVVELIKNKNLPRELALAPAARTLYTEIWDALQNEK